MNKKNVFTAVLLLFVGFSLAYLFTSEAQPPAVPEATSQLPAARPDSTLTASEEAPREGRKIVAYYFYTNQRCITCRTIEEFTHEALEGGFADDLEHGRLVWRPVNVQSQDNRHFIQDYQLTSKSVVLAEMAGEEQTRWKNLDQVWLLVRDKKAFLSYIQDETRDFLGE